MSEKYLIKDTTREQREQIVKRSLGCGDCNFDNDFMGLGNVFDMYKPYIDGKKEISEINSQIYGGTVH